MLDSILGSSFLLLTTLFVFSQYVENKWLFSLRSLQQRLQEGIDQLFKEGACLDGTGDGMRRSAVGHGITRLFEQKAELKAFERDIQTLSMPYTYMGLVLCMLAFYGIFVLFDLLQNSDVIVVGSIDFAYWKGLSSVAARVLMGVANIVIPIIFIISGWRILSNRGRRDELERNVSDEIIYIVRDVKIRLDPGQQPGGAMRHSVVSRGGSVPSDEDEVRHWRDP